MVRVWRKRLLLPGQNKLPSLPDITAQKAGGFVFGAAKTEADRPKGLSAFEHLFFDRHQFRQYNISGVIKFVGAGRKRHNRVLRRDVGLRGKG